MREIKFRAVVKTDDGVFVTPVLDWVDFANKTCDWTTYSRGTDEFEETESIYKKLLQSTGLKDKNGREIYEGDVIKFTYWLFDGNYIDEELIGIIKYKPERMSFVLTDIKPTHRDFGNEIEFASLTFDEADFEVIGNIFENENKELLEQGK